MHSYLVIGQGEEIRKEVSQLVSNLSLERLNFPVTKIQEVRDLAKLTKTNFAKKTAIIMSDFDHATEEAQNAFLKSLEEPQTNVVFVLTAKDSDLLLPTIVSRCQVVTSENKSLEATPKQVEEIENFLDMSIGKKLDYISKLSKKEEALAFTTSFILVGHQKLKTAPKLAYSLEKAQRVYDAIQKNANPRLQLTNFVISSDLTSIL